MLMHHFFFSYLNEKSFDSDAAELPPIFRDQNNVAFIGTTIAHAARAVLSIAIGITFSQIFWETLRSRSFTIRQIDALVKCGQSPFTPSALRAATASSLVFLISCIASAMALVVIITPGSLTISLDAQRFKPCTVPTVPDLRGLLYPLSDSLTESAENILASGTYLPPFRAHDMRLRCFIVLIQRLLCWTRVRLHRRERSDELHRFSPRSRRRPHVLPHLERKRI